MTGAFPVGAVPGGAATGGAVPGGAVPDRAVRRPRLAARLLIGPIRFYQRNISPFRPPTCRYTPTCSAYAVQALAEHGAGRGAWLALRRLLRCHPWHAGGHDPVPPPVGPDGAGPGLIPSRPRQELPLA